MSKVPGAIVVEPETGPAARPKFPWVGLLASDAAVQAAEPFVLTLNTAKLRPGPAYFHTDTFIARALRAIEEGFDAVELWEENANEWGYRGWPGRVDG